VTSLDAAGLRLLIPGPVPLSPAVSAELRRPVEPHYGTAWRQVHAETVELLRRAFGTAGDVLLLCGSGSVGLDAAIGSLVVPGDRVLVGVNGYFGTRLADMARAHGATTVELRAEWGSALDPRAAERALTADTRALVLTHVETSTGVVNPVREIAAMAGRWSVPVVVDAISSVGGMSLLTDEWGIDVCVGASQKCLGGPSGLAPVAVSERGWAAVERAAGGHSWYLDLRTWREGAVSRWPGHPSPVTMPTHIVRALRQGLRELMDEGVGARATRFATLGVRLRQGLAGLGFAPLAAERDAAPVVTAARTPPGIVSGDVVEELERDHRIRIAGGGIGPLHDAIIRIGHMAPGSDQDDVEVVLQALATFNEPASRPRAGAGIVGGMP
jgi:alanine-glyoxylate transaminase/serine-glyoxylate transaminase/serine-pyruvate transaminase